MKDQLLSTRLFSNLGVSLCANAIDIAGVQLVPDGTKAYLDYTIAHTWPAITAYGTALHPGTVANSYRSMLHQVFNKARLMKASRHLEGERPRFRVTISWEASSGGVSERAGLRLAAGKGLAPYPSGGGRP